MYNGFNPRLIWWVRQTLVRCGDHVKPT